MKEHVENLENIWSNLSYRCKNKGSGRGGALTEEMRPGCRPAGPQQSALPAPEWSVPPQILVSAH